MPVIGLRIILRRKYTCVHFLAIFATTYSALLTITVLQSSDTVNNYPILLLRQLPRFAPSLRNIASPDSSLLVEEVIDLSTFDKRKINLTLIQTKDDFINKFIKSDNDGAVLCWTEGTDKFAEGKCTCRHGYSGISCSIPLVVSKTNEQRKYKKMLKRNSFTNRKKRLTDLKVPAKKVEDEVLKQKGGGEDEPVLRLIPRRVVYAMSFNIDFEMLEAHFLELGDLVDVFIVMESNYSFHIDAKPLRLMEAFQAGAYKDMLHKIIYVHRNFVAKGAHTDGWLEETDAKNYVSKAGLPRISGLQDDDLFLISDPDELPSREVVLFLKFHDNYPLPAGVSLSWHPFRFYWKNKKPYPVMLASSIRIFRRVFNNQANSLKGYSTKRDLKLIQKAARNSNGLPGLPQSSPFKPDLSIALAERYIIGNNQNPAGWHCTWCMEPQNILVKLISAISYKKNKRWGDFKSKRDLTYIQHLIQSGTWFDDKEKFINNSRSYSQRNYCPMAFKNNLNKYQFLLTT